MNKSKNILNSKNTLDDLEIQNYIDRVQAKLPNINISIDNVNDFGMMLIEKNNCKKCKGLNKCSNSNKGYFLDYLEEENSFKYNTCKYLHEYKISSSQDSLIKTLYISNKILGCNLLDVDIDTPSRRKIFEHIETFLEKINSEEPSKGLYLYGKFRVGKTFILGCIANELARRNISTLLIYFPDLVFDLKSAIGTPRVGSLVNMLKTVDVLMLDDFGGEYMTQWFRDDILGPIINYRMLENKPIFISSNLNCDDELTQHLAIDGSAENMLSAGRIVSRLQAMVKRMEVISSKKYSR